MHIDNNARISGWKGLSAFISILFLSGFGTETTLVAVQDGLCQELEKECVCFAGLNGFQYH